MVALVFFVSLFLTSALRYTLGELFSKNISLIHIVYFIFNLIIEQIPFAIPIVSLFSGILASNRLSSDQELMALRAVGVSEFKIYGIFLKMGLFLFLILALFSFYISPLQIRQRRAISEWLATYQSVAFVKPGSFFNKSDSRGDHTDLYVVEKEKNTFKDIFLHHWLIDDSKVSLIDTWNDDKINVGQSQTKQIIFAKKGKLIAKPKDSSNTNFKKELSKQIKFGSSHIPMELQKRDLFDLSYLSDLPNLEIDQKVQKYLRLENGYIIEINNNKKYTLTSFHNGVLDFALNPPPKSLNYISITQQVLTLFELLKVYLYLDRGGLIFDPSFLAGLGSGPIHQYIELPKLNYLNEIEKNLDNLSKLSNFDIYKKYNFYIPINIENSESRLNHLKYIINVTKDIANHKTEFIYTFYRRICEALSVFIFLLIAYPLGTISKRSGRGSSFALALIVYVVYSSLVFYLSVQVPKNIYSPFILATSPILLVFICALIIIHLPQEGFTQLGFLNLIYEKLKNYIIIYDKRKRFSK